jgi:hypothetical protein
MDTEIEVVIGLGFVIGLEIMIGPEIMTGIGIEELSICKIMVIKLEKAC